MKERTRKLKNDLNKYSSALQNVDMPLILTDSDGKINEINSSAENLTGWMSLEKKSQNVDAFFSIKGSEKSFWSELHNNLQQQNDSAVVDINLNFQDQLFIVQKDRRRVTYIH